MKYGHSTGTKTVSRKSQSWYDQTAEANIARIEAEQAAKDDAARAAVTRLAKVVGAAVTAMPEAASRIAKAATLVQTGQVWSLTSGSYLVGSQSDAQSAHLVKRGPWSCTCADHIHRQTTCKHIIAVQISIRMGTDYNPSYN